MRGRAEQFFTCSGLPDTGRFCAGRMVGQAESSHEGYVMSLNAKWPCGPLEVARLNRFNIGDVELRTAVGAWTHPSALQLLKGSPINCLIVDWASGTPEDATQQLALRPLIQAGRRLGLSFVGNISVTENLESVVVAAHRAGLEAVLVRGFQGRALALPTILQFPSDGISWDITTPIFSALGCTWPQANVPALDENMDGDTASAGPTANPWADSNGWLTLLARNMASGKALWLEIDPPDSAEMLRAEDYRLAIADSRVYGSRWVVSLENQMRIALLKKDQTAMKSWKRICETLSFFESHAEWNAYEPMGVLGVVSDFKGRDRYTSQQLLNLLDRRQVPFVVVDRTRPLPTPDVWQKGIFWVDDEPPDSGQKKLLLAFAQQGGVVIAASYWGPPGLSSFKEDWLYGYSIYNVAKGRFVVADGGFPDPYQLSRDAHLLVSRKNDFVRLYNPGTTKYYSSIDSGRKTQVIQMLNYSTEAASYVTLWVDMKAGSARLWSPETRSSPAMEVVSAYEGSGFDLPSFPVNCAVEIERLAWQ
jgi:hypothetical protein